MSYRVLGNKVYDNGRHVHFLGVNVLGMELKEGMVFGLGWGSLTMPDFVSAIKKAGFNAVRLPITTKTIANTEVQSDMIGAGWVPGNAGLAGKKSMELCDVLIDELEKNGIRYIFDLHYLEAGHPGDIPNLWYTDKYPESKWLGDLSALSERYRGKPGFVGIDLKNEPNGDTATWGSGDLKTDWRLACERAYQVISAVNQDIIIWVEALGSGQGINQLISNPPAIPADRVSYSIHVYGKSVWHDFGEGFKDPSFPENMPKVWDKMFGAASKLFSVNVGEWGGILAKDKPWHDAFAEYLKKNEIDNFYWAWQGVASADTSGILIDGGYKNQDEAKLRVIQSLKTANTTFTTDKLPEVKPPVTTPPKDDDIVITKPQPTAHAFKPGDIVRLITGNGQDMFVLGYSLAIGAMAEHVDVGYFNSVSGKIENYLLPEQILKIKTVQNAPIPK